MRARNLRERQVGTRLGHIIQITIHHVGHHTDNLQRLTLVVAKYHALADWIIGFQESRGESFIYQDHSRRLRVVLRAEQTTSSQLGADGGEVAGRGDAKIGMRLPALLEGRLADNLKT